MGLFIYLSIYLTKSKVMGEISLTVLSIESCINFAKVVESAR